MVFFKKSLLFIIIFLFIFIIPINTYCATATGDFNVERDVQLFFEQRLNQFVIHSMQQYFINSEYWNLNLKPVYDDIFINDRDFLCYKAGSGDTVIYYVRTFYRSQGTYISANDYTFSGEFSPDAYNMKGMRFTNSGRYQLNYNPVNFTGSSSFSVSVAEIPACCAYIRTDIYFNFINMVYGNNDATLLLDSIEDYLSDIKDVDDDILSALNSLSSTLTTISSNTSNNYSQQISNISSQISDILTDNDTIISQNSSMIQQQEEINDNLEDLNDNLSDVKDTITDDTVESDSSDLPSASVNDPSETGIATIFQSIYNAFCVGNAQDIVFPIPFTNKNITLSPYYVSDMLTNNGASWVYTLIQAFWGYLIGRFVVSDISKKIDKVKSGNIENIENGNIKEEML